jgi:mannose-1-phosphate guanylyltransferase
VIAHALILTAGLGTRLRPLTDVRAKPAIPVAGEPMIRRIVRWLVSGGVTDFVLNLHHLPETITSLVGDGSDLGARVRYSWEQPTILGSGGGPRLALPLIGADPFFIINGDTLTDVDLVALADAHVASGALATLALVPNLHFDRYGGVVLDADRSVSGFVGRGPSAKGSYHYIGVQAARASAFSAIRAGAAARSIGGVYDAIIANRPGAIRGFVTEAAFWDVGTVADYWHTTRAFSAMSAAERRPAGRTSRLDSTARVTDSILWDDVEVGARAVVERCIVTDGVRIPDEATYRNAILMQHDGGLVAAEMPVT